MNSILARLIIGQICLHACMAGVRLAAPLLALSLGYSAVAVGVLLSLFALSSAVLALPAGRFADRHHLQRPLGLSVTMACFGAGAAAIYPEYWVLCLAALCTGAASGVALIALQRHVGRAANDALELKKAFAWLSVGPALSNFLGPLLAGLLIDYSGYTAAFIAMTVLPLLCWYWVHDVPPVKYEEDTGPVPAKTPTWTLLQNPSMRRVLLVNWLLSSCMDVHTFLVPVIGHSMGYSASTIGAILGGFAISVALVRGLIPFLAEYLREWVLMAGALLLAGLIYGMYPMMQAAWAMGLCSILLGLALGSAQPMVMSTLHHITPEHRQGEALGLRLMLINGSSVAMPIIFGALSTVVGVSAIFWGVATVASLGSKAALRLQDAIVGSDKL